MNLFLVVGVLALVLITGVYGFNQLKRLSLQNLVLTVVGALVGLLLGALLSVPISRLPSPFGDLLPIITTLVIVGVMVQVAMQQRAAVVAQMPFLEMKLAKPQAAESSNQILVDTSVIIDGRIADVAKAGFIPGRLLVPRFVLAELQNIADSDDAMRRGRGRRGLEILNSLREDAGIKVEIIEADPEDVAEVDAKLIRLAQQLGTDILTTDYNLNRVAQIEGVRVLNVNELSNAIRPVVLPGEEMAVKIVQAGKERGQGVGYLPDGTMIVVDQGDKLIGQEVSTEVTRVFQTVAGKMIFASPKQSNGEAAKKPARKRKRTTAN